MYNSRNSKKGFCLFIDENLEDKFVSVLSVLFPAALQQMIYRVRERHSLYDEIKWSKISSKKANFYCDVLDVFFSYSAARISITPIYHNKERAILHALKRVQPHCEIISAIFIDWYTVPSGYSFEDQISRIYHCDCVMRLDSKSNDLLQLVDLLMNIQIKSQCLESVLSHHKKKVLQTYLNYSVNSRQAKVFVV